MTDQPTITTVYDRLRPVIKAIPQQHQTQAALNEQLDALHAAAVRLGLYDAADYLRNIREPR